MLLGQVWHPALGADHITSHEGTLSLDPALMAISDTLQLPLGQIRDPTLRAGEIPCPAGRSNTLPWGHVKYPALEAGQRSCP